MKINELKKRARNKHIGNFLALSLAALKSPLEKSYWHTYYCCNQLTQEGNKLKSKYCRHRWCTNCNRIRTANLIDGYTPELNKFKEPQFVTLTIKNPSEQNLQKEMEKMFITFNRIKDRLRKKGIKLFGIRKIEVTFNKVHNTYHPHFHFIIDGLYESAHLLNEWLKDNPTADMKGQDIRPADEKSIKELFKYFTKLVSGSKRKSIAVYALDVIFQTMRGLRVFQPMGIKKYVSEDIEEIQCMLFEDLKEDNTAWNWDYSGSDWFHISEGAELTGYIPDKKSLKFINLIE